MKASESLQGCGHLDLVIILTGHNRNSDIEVTQVLSGGRGSWKRYIDLFLLWQRQHGRHRCSSSHRGKILYVKCYSRLLCKSWFLCKIKCSQWHNTILSSQFHLFPCTEACVWFLTALTFSQIQPQRLLSITAVVIFHLLEILKGRIGHVQRLPAEKHHFTGI